MGPPGIRHSQPARLSRPTRLKRNINPQRVCPAGSCGASQSAGSQGQVLQVQDLSFVSSGVTQAGQRPCFLSELPIHVSNSTKTNIRMKWEAEEAPPLPLPGCSLVTEVHACQGDPVSAAQCPPTRCSPIVDLKLMALSPHEPLSSCVPFPCIRP